MTRRIVGPFNRVEGDLEVRLEINDSRVTEAYVTSTLYRGFEQILQGKDPRDALVYTPRICGICSVSQLSASAMALAQAQGITPPRNGCIVSNLILATENIADHLTHFYLFFMPDFARSVYQSEAWFDWVEARFKAVKGSAHRDMLPARAEFMHVAGLLAGKWPHTLTIQPGGSTKAVNKGEKARLRGLLSNFRRFLERFFFSAPLDSFVELKSKAALDDWREDSAPTDGDVRSFLFLARELDLKNMGRASGRFLSYGAYFDEGVGAFKGGVLENGKIASFSPDDILEDISHAWLVDRDISCHPYNGRTVPDVEQKSGYTWCKAPRLRGKVMEVGALARQLIDGHPLIQDMVREAGESVEARVVARILEVARTVQLMERWVEELQPSEPFYVTANMPDEAHGAGLIEAARGSLGHWLKIKNGCIENYQVIAPTTWNFSPRDANGTPGALEQALQNAPVRAGEKDPVSVQHIVRSFDPCMVCTVH